jgi:signal transduction histidine kinase
VSEQHDALARCGCTLELSADTPVVGYFDKRRIEQVTTVLLTNAMKYGANRPIRASVTTEGERARLTIRDFGIGIAREDQERIFERFARAVSVTHYGGLGLGLYIARRVVEAHHGTIRVESTPGAGATFVVDLPLRAEGE